MAGRMVVAAANRNWLPRFLGFIGQIGFKDKSNESNDTPSEHSSRKSDAPINAIILSTTLPILYILFGNFRSLLTFNGLGEYTFFFMTVLGAIILRFREPELRRPYKPFILIPVIFAVVSGFVVGAAFAPTHAVILIVLWFLGFCFYSGSKRWREARDA